jgi:hypothetical protein
MFIWQIFGILPYSAHTIDNIGASGIWEELLGSDPSYLMSCTNDIAGDGIAVQYRTHPKFGVHKMYLSFLLVMIDH